MISFFIGLLTVVLVLDCFFLVLLVLVQLPKKEAGMGQAFGGAATDALFGAGSGNALTKLTKWAAGIFFALAIVLTVMANFATSKRTSRLSEIMSKTPAAVPPPVATTQSPPATTAPAIDLKNPATGAAPKIELKPQPAPPNAAPPTTTTPPPANK